MKNILVILGNGFDLDLGLRTRYSDFWLSKQHIINKVRIVDKDGYHKLIPPMVNYIPRYLSSCWFDFEEAFRWYASSTIKRNYETTMESISHLGGLLYENHEANIKYYNVTRRELIKFLTTQQNRKRLKKNSIAAQFLRELADSQDTINICTLNYTNPNDFAEKLGILQKFNVEYIHGSLKEKNIVLGVGEDQVYSGYEFLYKNEQGAKKFQLKQQLYQADEVIFFGVGFGYNDIHYFKEFFQNIISHQHKTKLTIYTYNEKEANNIDQRLRSQGISVDSLCCHANLKFRFTSK